jgi:hypothetical protein
LLFLEFADRTPINLLIHRDDALGMQTQFLRTRRIHHRPRIV